MAQDALLNPLYIEQYGVIYVNPYDYAGLSTIYHSQDTRGQLPPNKFGGLSLTCLLTQ